MTPDTLFNVATMAAMAGWLMLALLAPFRRAPAVRAARWAAAILAGFYTVMLVRGLLFGPGLPAGAGFSTLAGVMLLFQAPAGVLTGWVHYLAFDLFIGAWETEDAGNNGIPHALLLPCLLLTFMAGPFGLLLFLLLKASWRRKA
jgi:hypothetical protein